MLPVSSQILLEHYRYLFSIIYVILAIKTIKPVLITKTTCTKKHLFILQTSVTSQPLPVSR